MERRSRNDMIAETRAKLIAAGRKAFADKGYADASMDDFTAEAGLTRGALYHHFGDKKGLLAAVIAEIDAEMTEHLRLLAGSAATPWEGFLAENIGYLTLALDPEIQRTVLRDGPAVLGDPSTAERAELRGHDQGQHLRTARPRRCARHGRRGRSAADHWRVDLRSTVDRRLLRSGSDACQGDPGVPDDVGRSAR